MKILIAGAGAVGQVYGWHLHQAGHDVAFFVKAKYQNEVGAGLTLHRLGRDTRQDWPAVRAISDLDLVAGTQWDQIWLTFASDALRGDLATALLRVIGDATVVCLQPDMEDGDYVRAHVPSPNQVVQGLITFISYQSPLPGHAGPEGIAYYLPPLAPGLFSGEAARVGAVVRALKAGGLAAKVVPDLAKTAGGAPALLQPIIAGLEASGWRIDAMMGGANLPLGLAAAREALAVAERSMGANTTALKLLLRPWVWRLLVPVIRRVLPLPLEPYLHYHFAKVGAQTRLMLDTYIRLGQQHGLDTAALQSLRAALPAIGEPA
jgi:2-dehydropantoate 2-reductase